MMSRIGSKGFTLIEVMVTTVILCLGTVFVQEGLLGSAKLLGRYAHTLKAERWMDERIVETKESLFYSGNPLTGNQAGSFVDEGKEFSWNLEVNSQAGGKDLFLIALTVRWEEGHRPVQLTRSLWATNIDKVQLS